VKSTRMPMVLTALIAASPALSAGNEITVWVDAARQPAVKAFVEAHPEVKVNMILDGGSSGASGTFQTKIGFADQAGSGWLDVVFSQRRGLGRRPA
jgi:multiple sugar transport system substrate-binding protein